MAPISSLAIRCPSEQIQTAEYLPAWRPIIDAVGGDSTRLISQMVFMDSGRGMTARDVCDRMEAMQQEIGGGRPVIVHGIDGMAGFMRRRLVNQGLATEQSGVYTPTDAGRRSLGLLAVYADTLVGNPAFGSFGTIVGQRPPAHDSSPLMPYANRPMANLRMLQYLLSNSERAVPVSELRSQTPGYDRSGTSADLQRLKNFQVVTATAAKSGKRPYRLTSLGSILAEHVLGKICSLSDDTFHAQAVNVAREILSDSEAIGSILYDEPRILAFPDTASSFPNADSRRYGRRGFSNAYAPACRWMRLHGCR